MTSTRAKPRIEEPSKENTSDATGIDPPSREEQIRQAAYRRYETRGSSEGQPEQDWLDAEAEVDSGNRRGSSGGT